MNFGAGIAFVYVVTRPRARQRGCWIWTEARDFSLLPSLEFTGLSSARVPDLLPLQ